MVQITPETPTLALAEFASKLRLQDLPDQTVERVRAYVLDTIGCAVFGSTQPWSKTVNEWVQRQGGPGESSLWTTDFRGPAAGVALGLGTMAHAFDLDDYHNSKTHPGAVVIPAAMAVAEARDLSGERLMAAVAAGYEVMVRVSLAGGPGPIRMRGWHLTGICGTLGAAAAVANLLGLDTPSTASALGMAGTQSSGTWAFTADGAASKRFHAGRAAQSGIMAAELAELGYWGPHYILEAEDGGLLSAVSPSPNPKLLVEGLGSHFHGGYTSIKPYSACGSLHSGVDAVVSLAQQYDITPEKVEQITMRTSSVVIKQCGFPFEPTSVLQGQMSAQYVLAVSLADRNCLPPQFTEEKLHDPKLLALADRVKVVQDPEIEEEYPGKFSVIMDIALQDGRKVSTKVDNPKGSSAIPLSAAEVREKFMALSGGILPAERLNGIAERVSRLESVNSVREVVELLPEMTVVEQLAELAAGLKLEAIPPGVAHAGRRALLDTLGVAIGGSQGPAAAAARRAYVGRAGTGSSLILGGGEADAETAALCNGTAAHSLEMDDFHRAATVHPGAVVVPAALAVAQEQKADGACLLESAIAGYEVAIRLGMATRGVLYGFGFHPTAVVGVFGAAAAAARAMGLDAERTAHAMALAGTRASGLAAHKVRGDWSKRLQPGTSSAQGLGAARLAAAGFTGPLEVVEGLYGFVFAYARGNARVGDILEGLGERFHTPDVSFKPYPSCRFTHAPMDALLAAQRRGSVRPDEIRRIECTVHAQAMASVMTPVERKYRPETSVDAQFSLPYCLAVVALKGQAPLEVFQPAALGDTATLEMAARVVAVEDPAYTALFPARNAARVSLHTDRGIFTSEVLDAKGDPESPMSDADLEAKFVALGGPVLGEGAARDLAGLVWAVDQQPSLEGITELLRGACSNAAE